MKKLLIFILLLAGLAGIYFWPEPKQEEEKTEKTGEKVGEFQPDPSSATFSFYGEEVSLSNGQHESVEDELGSRTETILLEPRGYGDINDDKKADTVVFLVRSGVGSGVFVYVAGFVSGPVNYRGTGAIFLGDRISPVSLSVSGGVVPANYLDRKEDEPLSAEPTVAVSKAFIYRKESMEEK